MTLQEVLAALDPSDPFAVAALLAGAVALLLAVLTLAAMRRAGRAAEASAALAVRVAALDAGQARAAQGLEASLAGASARTAESLGALQERLAAIDRAQENIERLSGDVLGLQDILSNKQARGAFGEIQLFEIVSAALPPDAYRWQATLPNGTRADCVIDLPNPPGPLVIDSKFPLEPYEHLMAAEPGDARRKARRVFRTAVREHIRAIAAKYVLPGVTADGALLFLPSEAVYAELHAHHGEVVREGFAARVWIVSPTTCMAVLNTVRAVVKDVRLKEQAGAIRDGLRLLQRDVELIAERAEKLGTHFARAQADIEGIGTAAHRAARRAGKLEAIDLEREIPEDGPEPPAGGGLRILRG